MSDYTYSMNLLHIHSSFPNICFWISTANTMIGATLV